MLAPGVCALYAFRHDDESVDPSASEAFTKLHVVPTMAVFRYEDKTAHAYTPASLFEFEACSNHAGEWLVGSRKRMRQVIAEKIVECERSP